MPIRRTAALWYRFPLWFACRVATEFMVGETPGWNSPGLRRCRQAALTLLTLEVFAELVLPSRIGTLSNWFWPAAAICSVLELAVSLPLQNAIAASLQTAGIAWVAAALGSRIGIPTTIPGSSSARLPGGGDLLWLAAWIALSPVFRRLARAILGSRRHGDRLGFQVLGTTVLLTGGTAWMFQAALGQASMRGLFLWIATAVVLHGINTPWLLNKRPAREPGGLGMLWLPGLIAVEMTRTLAASATSGTLAGSGLGMLLVMGLAWRGLARTR